MFVWQGGVINPSIPSPSTTTTTIDDAHPQPPHRPHPIPSSPLTVSSPLSTPVAQNHHGHNDVATPRHPAPTTFASPPASVTTTNGHHHPHPSSRTTTAAMTWQCTIAGKIDTRESQFPRRFRRCGNQTTNDDDIVVRCYCLHY